MKTRHENYFTMWADYEGGTCTKCGWGPADHGHDADREHDYCVFERNEAEDCTCGSGLEG